MEEDKLLDLLTNVKNMVKSDPAQARTALTGHPNLAYALMKEMVILDVIDADILTRTLQAATGVQPTPAALAPTHTYAPPPQNPTPTYPPSVPTYPSTSAPPYPPTSAPTYPPPSTQTYPPPNQAYPPPAHAYPPPPTQAYNPPPPQPPGVPPHVYQQQQQRQQPTPPQAAYPSRAPPPAPQQPPQASMGLAPEQQETIRRLAMLTPEQIAALPPADRAALLELRRQLGLS